MMVQAFGDVFAKDGFHVNVKYSRNSKTIIEKHSHLRYASSLFIYFI